MTTELKTYEIEANERRATDVHEFVGPKRKQGRPVGTVGKYGARPGSRPWTLTNMKPGDVELFKSPRGRSQAHMQQVASDITRCNLQGKVRLSLVLGIEVSTREVIEIVMATREGE